MEKLMTKQEVCELLRISPTTLSRIVADGSLPAMRIRGRIMYQSSDVAKYLESCREIRVPVPERRGAVRRSTRVQSPARTQTPPRYIPGMKVV